MNQTRLIPTFQNVAATGTAVCDLYPEVTGTVLESITLVLGGTTFTRSHIVAWRIKANGKVVRESTGAATDTINKFNGFTEGSTYLLIDFMNPKFRTPNAFAVGAFDLGRDSGIKQLTLEVDISGATAPTLTGYVEVSPSLDIPAERGIRWAFLREHRAQVTLGAAGEFDIASSIPHFTPQGGGSVYRAIHLFAANITDIRVRRQGIDEFKFSVAVMQQLQARAGRTAQSSHVCFDPCLDNMVQGRVFDTTSRLPTDPVRPGAGVTSANFFVTMSGSETFWVQTQELILFNDY